MTIKAVIFDMNGVLMLEGKENLRNLNRNGFHSRRGFHSDVARKFGINLDIWFDTFGSAYSKSVEGKLSLIQVLEVVANDLQINKEEFHRYVIKTYRKSFKRNSELFRIAWNLKKKRYKIAILSDQWPISKEALVNPRDMKKFNKVVLSCDVGMRKPNPKIYRYVLKKLDINAREVVFIDDREWNTKPAEKLGIKTILFKDNKQVLRELKKLGVEI